MSNILYLAFVFYWATDRILRHLFLLSISHVSLIMRSVPVLLLKQSCLFALCFPSFVLRMPIVVMPLGASTIVGIAQQFYCVIAIFATSLNPGFGEWHPCVAVVLFFARYTSFQNFQCFGKIYRLCFFTFALLK